MLEITSVEVGVLLFLLGHLGTAIWVGATVKADVRNMKATVEDLAKDVKQLARQAAKTDPKLEDHERRIERLEGRGP